MTLIEIMVVIAILGLIAGAVSVNVIRGWHLERKDRAANDIKVIDSALKVYYTRKGHYPDTASGLNSLVELQILERVPNDPWGHPYVYALEGARPLITSYGRDGVPGGEGADADLSNRQELAR